LPVTWAAVELSEVTLLADREHQSEHLTAGEIGPPPFRWGGRLGSAGKHAIVFGATVDNRKGK
jgi:hypothetical protein